MMKTLRFLFAANLGLAATTLCFGSLAADSHITTVTVYADRAIVTRNATLDVAAAGTLEVVFANLPAQLVEQSLQISGRGTAQATILDVAARAQYLEAPPNERAKTLEDELHELNKQKRNLDDRGKILGEQQSSLGKIEFALTSPSSKDAARPTLQELSSLLLFLGDQRSKISADSAALDDQRETLQAKIDAVEKQLNELRNIRGRSVKHVTVRLAAASAGKLDLALSYAMPNASWTPAYDARLRLEERAITLSYFGMVRNSTGEDWKDVLLTLSTAHPSLGGGAPELAPWVVDVRRPMESQMALDGMFQMKRKSLMEEKRQAFNLAATQAAPNTDEPKQEMDADLATATVESDAISATFKIPAPVSLASDNNAQKVSIATTRFAAVLQFQATPRMRETAFLSAYVTNTSEYPLLDGAMNTFLDNTFIAASSLKTVMPGEKFELALGADEGIAIKRKLVNRFSEDTGITSKYRRITYEFLVTITNNKKTAEKLVFKDVIPVSRDEKITVKLLTPAERDLSTKETPKEVTREEDGKLVWRLILKPGEKRELPLKFYVEHPAETPITGLE